ncbi:MAG: peptidoglycan DD-metalloendopeptidase family protein [Oscillospiraceae bacterium]
MQLRIILKPMQAFASKIETMEKLCINAGNLTGNAKRAIFIEIVKLLFKNVFYYGHKCFNFIIPIVALIFTINVFNHYNSIIYALKVEYNGIDIGFINTESEFYKAEKMMRDRIIHESYQKPLDTVPRFSLEVVNKTSVTSIDDLTNKIISASGNELIEADGLYVDKKFVGALENSSNLFILLDNIIATNKTGQAGEKVSFIKKIDLKKGLYPITSVVSFDTIESILTGYNQEQKTYIVQKNDVPSTIAEKFNMPYNTLKALNPEIETKLLIGQEVLISKAVPYLEVKRTVTTNFNDEIPFKIERTVSKDYNTGYSKVTSQGINGIKNITAEITYIDGIETDRKILSSEIIREPSNEKIILGGNTPSTYISASSNDFIWPVDGGKVTCGFMGYWGHTGMDIGVSTGTGIRASASGTVVIAKNLTYGYGRYVKIDHGGGWQTLYGHNSKLLVVPGQWVEKGELIALSGSSGRSSGPHCHFEIIKNGQYQNPAKFVGTR